MMQGYAHPDYARALDEYGTPLELPHCGGWLLERSVPGSAATDAMGCYPLFCCRDWSGLQADLDAQTGRLVCVHLVSDPFGNYTPEMLQAFFPERAIAFKQHYVLDLHESIRRAVRKRTQSYARAALRDLRVETCHRPLDHLDDWLRLYGALTARYELRGIQAFSRRSFRMQMAVPGLVLFRAVHGDRTVAMLSWFVQGDVAYAHLMGMDASGYRLRAAYALYWSAINHFAHRLRWLDFGGVPGSRDDAESGLAQFKKGWANTTRWSYFCGRILDPASYNDIVSKNGIEGAHFPPYRAGDFGL